MAASSWATYLASKALLEAHGSVEGVKAAAKGDASVVAPLTEGLDKWNAIDAAVKEAAQHVDIVIPARRRSKAALQAAATLLAFARSAACLLPRRRCASRCSGWRPE